jgi:FkbM family methyltransferase
MASRPAKARAIIALLVCVLLVLLATHGGELFRRARFAVTGQIPIEGIPLAFAPGDDFTEWLLENGPWEPQQTRLLISRLRPGDTFIDVGAYVGYYTLIAARRVGRTGRVIAFEPAPKNFETLRQNVRLNRLENVTLEQKALADKPGTLRLFLDELYGMNHTITGAGDGRRYRDVKALALDDYLANADFRVDLVKIDAEGAEGLILGGMAKTLDRHPDLKLVLEFSPSLLRKTGVDPQEMLDALLQRGFEARVIDGSKQGRPLDREAVPQFMREMRRQGRSSDNLLLFRAPATSSLSKEYPRLFLPTVQPTAGIVRRQA